ncbi:MAG: cupin domain-containing protein [Pararhodobacter sp.]|nr:cupin domain-containing protein [Pararhodobacter sp.]
MEFSKGLVTADKSFRDQAWNILGEPYRPIQMTPSSFMFHAEFAPGSGVPAHVHETQDEILHILEGELQFEMEGQTIIAGKGDTVTLPMGIAHALFNRATTRAEALVVVSPTGKFHDYMAAISGLTDPAEVIRLGAEHEITFV